MTHQIKTCEENTEPKYRVQRLDYSWSDFMTADEFFALPIQEYRAIEESKIMTKADWDSLKSSFFGEKK